MKKIDKKRWKSNHVFTFVEQDSGIFTTTVLANQNARFGSRDIKVSICSHLKYYVFSSNFHQIFSNFFCSSRDPVIRHHFRLTQILFRVKKKILNKNFNKLLKIWKKWEICGGYTHFISRVSICHPKKLGPVLDPVIF